MTKEEQQLFCTDLCARLPYGVMLTDGLHKLKLKVRLDTAASTVGEILKSGNLKYYLRPISSMTEDEFNSLKETTGFKYDNLELMECDGGLKVLEFYLNEIPSYALVEVFDWLNAHHFDYRGLIERGIALPAPEGMYTSDDETTEEKSENRKKTPFLDKNNVRIYDGDIFVYLKYTNFKNGVPLDLVENYSKYENEVELHPVFWDEDKKSWCSDVYGDCDCMESYDFDYVVVVTNRNEHPELYNH